jgi:hypothetical protein
VPSRRRPVAPPCAVLTREAAPAGNGIRRRHTVALT